MLEKKTPWSMNSNSETYSETYNKSTNFLQLFGNFQGDSYILFLLLNDHISFHLKKKLVIY